MGPNKKDANGIYYVIVNIVDMFKEHCEGLKIESIDITRQSDQINCGAFIIFDIITARNLIVRGIPLFSDGIPHQDFLNISQHTGDLSNAPFQCQRKKSACIDQMVNIKASFVALDVFRFYLSEKVEYPELNCCQDEFSEKDEEGCLLM